MILEFIINLAENAVASLLKKSEVDNAILSALVSLFGAVADALLKHHTSPQVKAVAKDVQDVVAKVQAPAQPDVGAGPADLGGG